MHEADTVGHYCAGRLVVQSLTVRNAQPLKVFGQAQAHEGGWSDHLTEYQVAVSQSFVACLQDLDDVAVDDEGALGSTLSLDRRNVELRDDAFLLVSRAGRGEGDSVSLQEVVKVLTFEEVAEDGPVVW